MLRESRGRCGRAAAQSRGWTRRGALEALEAPGGQEAPQTGGELAFLEGQRQYKPLAS